MNVADDGDGLLHGHAYGRRVWASTNRPALTCLSRLPPPPISMPSRGECFAKLRLSSAIASTQPAEDVRSDDVANRQGSPVDQRGVGADDQLRRAGQQTPVDHRLSLLDRDTPQEHDRHGRRQKRSRQRHPPKRPNDCPDPISSFLIVRIFNRFSALPSYARDQQTKNDHDFHSGRIEFRGGPRTAPASSSQRDRAIA